MTEQQEWCLHCGAAVGTRVAAAPGWRTPIAVAAAILAVAVVALAIALVQLADDTGRVAQAPTPTPAPAAPAVTPTPQPSVAPAATPTPTPTPTPTATQAPSGSGKGDAEWPSGRTAWTVILASERSKSAAQHQADALAQKGIAGVGVVHSDDFSSLDPGSWIVFSGQYDSQSQASDALDGIDVKDAYIRRLVHG
jgi:hypothetical protein